MGRFQVEVRVSNRTLLDGHEGRLDVSKYFLIPDSLLDNPNEVENYLAHHRLVAALTDAYIEVVEEIKRRKAEKND